MSEHEETGEFLRRCFFHDESRERQELEKEITQIQRKARCLQSATRLMAVLSALAAAGLCYPAILLENFPYGAPQFIVNLICALGVGSLINLLAFAGLGMAYRKKLNHRKRACQTEFLRRRMLDDENPALRKLQEEITRIHRNACCVQRATGLMAALTALAVTGLYYPGFLLENLSDGAPQFVVSFICALGLGSLISLLSFAVLGTVYRKKLDQQRLEYCQTVASLLDTRLSKPA
jgi:hypothetical protein